MAISRRLNTILDMLTSGRVLADIGTDHGYIPIEAVRRELCTHAVAGDIGSGPLERASEHVCRAGLEERIDLRLGSGLRVLSEGEADRIVIAGMGGPLMLEILEDRLAVALSAEELILGPQSELAEFREGLLKHFTILEESAVAEDGKFYYLIKAVPGTSPENDAYSSGELRYGRESLFSEDSRVIRREHIMKEKASALSILESLKDRESESALNRRREFEQLLAGIDEII